MQNNFESYEFKKESRSVNAINSKETRQILCTVYDKTFEGKKFRGSYPKLNTQGKVLRLSKNFCSFKIVANW